MNVQIRTTRFDADSRLIGWIKRRVEKLPSYYPGITTVGVFLRVDNPAHQIKDKVAEIRVHLPHRELFTRHLSKSFQQSFVRAYDSMVESIARTKGRQFR